MNDMENNSIEEQRYIRAKKRLDNLKLFYIHLLGYIILVVLLSYNLYIMEGTHKEFFKWFDITIMIAWTVFIVLHWWRVFKGKLFFKTNWEDKKIRQYMEEEHKTTMWK